MNLSTLNTIFVVRRIKWTLSERKVQGALLLYFLVHTHTHTSIMIPGAIIIQIILFLHEIHTSDNLTNAC